MFPHVTMETKGGLRGNEVMIITHLRTLRNLSSPSPRSPCGVVVLHTCVEMASFTDLTITCECTESSTPVHIQHDTMAQGRLTNLRNTVDQKRIAKIMGGL